MRNERFKQLRGRDSLRDSIGSIFTVILVGSRYTPRYLISSEKGTGGGGVYSSTEFALAGG